MAKTIFKNYAFFKALSENDRMTTRQVCEKVSCSYRNAHRYLRYLEAEGVVSSEMEGRRLIWKLNLENFYPCKCATSYNFSDVFSSLPLANNTPVVIEEYPTLKNTLVKRVTKVGDGSIIRLFNKTPMPPKYGDDIICPHFLDELRENTLDELFKTQQWREARNLSGRERDEYLINLYKQQLKSDNRNTVYLQKGSS